MPSERVVARTKRVRPLAQDVLHIGKIVLCLPILAHSEPGLFSPEYSHRQATASVETPCYRRGSDLSHALHTPANRIESFQEEGLPNCARKKCGYRWGSPTRPYRSSLVHHQSASIHVASCRD